MWKPKKHSKAMTPINRKLKGGQLYYSLQYLTKELALHNITVSRADVVRKLEMWGYLTSNGQLTAKSHEKQVLAMLECMDDLELDDGSFSTHIRRELLFTAYGVRLFVVLFSGVDVSAIYKEEADNEE